ncbi:Lanthionine synthetase C family protein [Rippkaea orientalis PCC 8801]|uniref:Lanthionine synthetase C family protein n=1 Tax=Rippkaea orientalis (strain PCC 8801 / RF-1) TaxID=41431 RepID=B7JYU0_RIPO1|nr:type 2 lanthipeptide synthetase LanM family protein [Rippkaea orientalis]ACK66017.1 Lanthionine synthetase C family protein [Rippkaea orientalis PCC 8801]
MNTRKIRESDLLSIVSRATFLSEKIQDAFKKKVNQQEFDQNLIDKRLKNWSRAVGGGDNLKKRINWDELDLNFLGYVLGSVDVFNNSSLPFWAETLKNILESNLPLFDPINAQNNLPIDSDNPLAFEEFYLAFIQFNRYQLYSRFSKNIIEELLTQQAYYALERRLLEQLVNLGTETLLFEFDKFRQNNIVTNKSTTSETPQKARYNTFIETLLQDKGLRFFHQYPVLARLLTTILDLWLEYTVEFLQRLQADLSLIELTFGETKNLGKVKEINTSLSDYYHQSYVLDLTFLSGKKIVYKPKNLAIDAAFYKFQDWCNQQNITLPFKVIKIINQEKYGWQEFVSPEAFGEEKEVKNFYQRAGMVLSMIYVLGGKNCQNIDLVAQGEFPIIIDADFLMSPLKKESDESESWFSNSVVKTGFLPSWEGDYLLTANAQDSSVLGGIFPQQINSSREWKFINTDQMNLVNKTVVIPPKNNVVVFQEKTVYPNNYLEEIVTGFEEIYRLLSKHKEKLLSKESPLLDFKVSQSKLILYPAVAYKILCKQSLNPQYLRNGIDFSLLLEGAARTYLSSEKKPYCWSILPAEIKALQQLTIPYFQISCDNDSLDIGLDKPLEHFFTTSSYQKLMTQLKSLDEKDLALQIQLIRLSFYAKKVHLTQGNLKDLGTYCQFSPLTSEELLEEAVRMGNALVNNAIHHGDNCNWIELEYMYKANRYRLKALDNSLFLGRIGVSLFLAALAKITGKNQFKEVALASIFSLRKAIKQGQLPLTLSERNLGIIGYGGLLYSFTKISRFLEESTLLEDGKKIVNFITKKAITKDHQLDIIFGAAGAILGLLALYQETEDQQVLDTAIDCGNHLLSQRTETFPKAWLTVSQSKKPLTGFSHGVAGIVLSLLRLFSVTGNTAYLEAAKEGIEYEKNTLDLSRQNLPDLALEQTQINSMTLLYAWCNGSAGIGLSRLGSLPILQLEDIDSEIKVALKTTQRYCQEINQDIDSLCCGTFGRTELFVVASQKLNNQEWLQDARKQAAWIIARRKENQEYCLFSHLASSDLNSNFFKGSAGIGYQLLRLAYPESFPSVLILE